jgi:class 3 adenylate cyclase/YHS domain-containing protein
VFADLAGFTAMTEAHGDEEAVELAHAFFALVRRCFRGTGSDEVKTIGDAIMIRSDEARAAIEIGLAITEELAKQPAFPIARIGMHTGPAVRRDADWFGATVNLAARVSGIAGGGEVVLTETTAQAAGPIDSIEIVRRGETRLRNVRAVVPLFSAIRTGATRGRLVIDPVCRMVVAPAASAGELTHGGVRYRFCSLPCAAEFAASPEEFVRGTKAE